MGDINDMAKDLAIETKNQGEKLQKLDENMAQADNNAGEALSELKSARKNQKGASKCQTCLIGLISVILLAVGLIIYFNYK